MDTRNLICIGCPMGCNMTVSLEDGEVVSVTGNTCKRGETYARKEVTNPTRIVTTSVFVEGAVSGEKTVSCKTEGDVMKTKIFDVIKALKGVKVKAPVHIGDIILKNVADTSVNVIATKEVL